MSATPRGDVLDPTVVGIYHAYNRCGRRASTSSKKLRDDEVAAAGGLLLRLKRRSRPGD